MPVGPVAPVNPDTPETPEAPVGPVGPVGPFPPPARSPNRSHELVAVCTNVAPEYVARNANDGVALTVTPVAPATVTVPVDPCAKSTRAPTRNATAEFGGTVAVIADPFAKFNSTPSASVRTSL